MDKQRLTPEEVLRVAYGNIIGGVEHPVLSAILAVNQGRIAEATAAIRYTIEHHMEIYKLSRGKLMLVPVREEVEEQKPTLSQPLLAPPMPEVIQ